MPKAMRRYITGTITPPEHSFRTDGIYCRYGVVKVYANKTQAEDKITELRRLGFHVSRSMDYPYTIILEA